MNYCLSLSVYFSPRGDQHLATREGLYTPSSMGELKSLTTINVYSIGFHQGCAFTRHVPTLMDELSFRMRVKFNLLPPMDLCADTRMMGQKPRDSDIARFVHHKNFKDWLRSIRSFIDTLEEENSTSKLGLLSSALCCRVQSMPQSLCKW